MLIHFSHLGLCDPWLLCPRDSPGKNIGVGSHFLFQGIFLAQGLNPGLWIAGRFFTVWATREQFISSQGINPVTLAFMATELSPTSPLASYLSRRLPIKFKQNKPGPKMTNSLKTSRRKASLNSVRKCQILFMMENLLF